MDRIARIVELQKLADASEEEVSRNRWAEAELIHDELKGSTFRELSVRIRTAGGSGYSNGHLHRMKRCWEVFGADNKKSGNFPNFYRAYNSPEVRGEPEAGNGSGEGHRKLGHPEDRSDHDRVTIAASEIYTIQRNPAGWSSLTQDDIYILRRITNAIQDILTGRKQAK